MIIRCPSCATGFEVPDNALGAGRKVRCNQCQHVWFADASSAAPEPVSPPVPEPQPAEEPAAQPEAAPEAEAEAAAPIPAPTIETSSDEGGEDATEEEPGEPAGDQEESSAEEPSDDVEPDAQDEDAEDAPDDGSLMATLAAMRAEAENEDLDHDDDEDEEIDFSVDHEGDLEDIGAMSRAMLIGWIALPVFLVVVLGLFFAMHGTISKAWPPSNQLYDIFGLSTDDEEEASSAETDAPSEPVYDPKEYISMDYSAQPSELADGTPALLIRGTITSSADFDIELAPMRGVLRNRLNQNIHQWDFELADSHVRAGGILPFTTSVADPPRDMTGLEIFLLWPTD